MTLRRGSMPDLEGGQQSFVAYEMYVWFRNGCWQASFAR